MRIQSIHTRDAMPEAKRPIVPELEPAPTQAERPPVPDGAAVEATVAGDMAIISPEALRLAGMAAEPAPADRPEPRTKSSPRLDTRA